MKKLILAVIALILFACVARAEDEVKQEAPLGFSQGEFVATVLEVKVVNPAKKLQFWKVRLDGSTQPSYVFTDREGKVGERVVIYVIRRGGSTLSWTEVRPL